MSTLVVMIIVAAVCGTIMRSTAGHTRRLPRERERLDRAIADLADDYDARLTELEAHYGSRISELEERVDFAERLLTQTGQHERHRDVLPTPQ